MQEPVLIFSPFFLFVCFVLFCFSCNDPKKVSLAKATVNSVEKITADLQDTARSVSEMALRENKTLEQNLSYMGVVERMNLLQREWATKVMKCKLFFLLQRKELSVDK